MAALRCSLCAVNWPADYSLFQYCPECGDPKDPDGRVKCSWMVSETPIDTKEARSRKRNADFERYYEQREAEKLIAAGNVHTESGEEQVTSD
jgi:hypothetical protein